MLVEDLAQLGHRPVLVVGRALDQEQGAAGAGALVQHLFIAHALDLAGTPLDGAIDLVTRHLQRLGAGNRFSEPRIAARIAAPHAGSDRDLSRQAREDLAASSVYRALFPLDRCPFRVATHRSVVSLDPRGPAPEMKNLGPSSRPVPSWDHLPQA
jgi:hypothetical protein